MTASDDHEIGAALAALETLPSSPLPEHVETFENIYRVLQDRLSQAEN